MRLFVTIEELAEFHDAELVDWARGRTAERLIATCRRIFGEEVVREVRWYIAHTRQLPLVIVDRDRVARGERVER